MSVFQNFCKPEGFLGKIVVCTMNSGHDKLAKWGFSHINPTGDAVVLDVGCGGGANVARWLSLCPKGKVIGVDYSDVAVDKSKSLNKKAIGDGVCEIMNANVADLPFEEGTFDYVSACETIYFWPGLEKCFKEVARVMKKGGSFLIVVEDDGEDRNHTDWSSKIDGMKVYTEADVTSALEKAGLIKTSSDHNEKHWMSIVAIKA